MLCIFACQAMIHEQRCKEVHERNRVDVALRKSPFESLEMRVISGWMGLSEETLSRYDNDWWKDLLQVTEGSKCPLSPAESERSQKPLLLYFPLHNHTKYLSAHRSLIKAEQCVFSVWSLTCFHSAIILFFRWSLHPHRITVLAQALQHIIPLTEVQQAVISHEIYEKFLLPTMSALRSRLSDACEGVSAVSDAELAVSSDSIGKVGAVTVIVTVTAS